MAVGRGWQHGRRKGEVMGKWGKEKKRKEKEKGLGYYIGLQFGPANGGEKWAKLGWNWTWAERKGLR